MEPPVVPRFIEALTAAGAAAVRVPAYLTTPGLAGPECCTAEAGLLQAGHIHAIAFSSTAEVGDTEAGITGVGDTQWQDRCRRGHSVAGNVARPLNLKVQAAQSVLTHSINMPTTDLDQVYRSCDVQTGSLMLAKALSQSESVSQ